MISALQNSMNQMSGKDLEEEERKRRRMEIQRQLNALPKTATSLGAAQEVAKRRSELEAQLNSFYR
jgi:hypothetical protein